jgi:PKD repeat protein
VTPPVVFSSDGQMMATGGSSEIKIWETSAPAAGWTLARTIRTYGGSITSLAFDPQGQWIFATNQGAALMQWRISDGGFIRELKAASTNSFGAFPLTVSRDGAYVAAAGLYNFQVAIWRVSDGAFVRAIGNNTVSFHAGAAFSPTQDLLAASGAFGVRVWRISDLTDPGNSSPAPILGFGGFAPVTFRPDGTQIAQPAGVYSAANGALHHTPGGIQYSGDGSRLVSVSGSTAKVYSAGGALVATINTGDSQLGGQNQLGFVTAGLSYSGDVLVTSGVSLKLWDTTDSSVLLRRLNGYSTGISAVGFSPDGGLLAAAEGGRSTSGEGIRVWQTSDFTQQRTLPGHSFGSSVLTISPTGDLLAAAGADWDTYPNGFSQYSAKVWRIADGALLWKFPLPDHSPRLAFSPDGTLLAMGLDNPSRGMQVVNVYTGAVTASWSSSTSGVGGMAFLPDNTLLIRHSREEKVRRWRVTNGAVQLGEFGPVGASGPGSGPMAVSPDGLTLATCSFEWNASASTYWSQVRLWRIADGALLGTLHQHLNSTSSVVFYSLSFSQDGHSVIAGGRGSDQALRIWRLSGGGSTTYSEEVGSGHPLGGVSGIATSSAGGLYAYGRDDATLVVAENPYRGPQAAPQVNAGPDVTVDEGDSFARPGSFMDLSGTSWTAAVDYGDGSGTQPLALNPDKTFDLSHTYADDGVYTVRVSVANEAHTGTDTLLLTVRNVAPTVYAGADGAIDEGGTFSGGGSFTDPGADTWMASVDYGDGSGVQALALNGNTFALSHLYAAPGTYAVDVMVSDQDGGGGRDTVQVTVKNVAPAVNAGADVTIDKGGTFSQSGSFADPGPGPWSATVDYGDGSGVQTLSLSGAGFSLRHTYADSGSYTVTVSVSDGMATRTDTVQVTVKEPDTTPPVTTAFLSPAANANGWHKTSVSVTLSASDAGSGVAHTYYMLDGGAAQTYSGAFTVSAEGTHTVEFWSVDNAGNLEAPHPSVGVNVDKTAPSLTTADVSATAASTAGAAVTFDPAASDGLSGLGAVTCSPASGSTFAPGKSTVTCTAADLAGYTTTKSFIVWVKYAWSGVLQPINADGSSIFKLGSTVPVKFELAGASADITDLQARLYVAKVSDGIAGTETEAASNSAADTGNLFRYDAAGRQYIFNFGTKSLSEGAWQLRIDLGDGTDHRVVISLRK